MMPIKILFYLPNLDGGGAERVMVETANLLSESGYSVILLVNQLSGINKKFLSPTIEINELRSARLRYSFFKLSKLFNKLKPDMIYSAMTHVNLTVTLAVKFSRINCKVVISERASIFTKENVLAPHMHRVFVPLMKKLYPMADHITVISAGIKKDLISLLGDRISPNKISVLYNPILEDSGDTTDVIEGSTTTAWIEKKVTPIITTVGRLTFQKNISGVIKAFINVRKKVPCRLLIVGEGEDRSDLEKLMRTSPYAEDIFFAGYVVNPVYWLGQSDIFVLNSRWEGLPGTLLQALKANCKLIATDCPSGPSEILDFGRWGQLIEVENQEQLEVAIINDLKIKNKRPDHSIRAEFFSKEQYLENLIRILTKA